jgi:hypothetical protein
MSNKMINTPWVIDEIRDEIHITGANSYGESICALYSDPMDDETRANAKAIVSAVNNTYGIGVNPDCVEDLLDACKEALRMYEEIEPAGGWQGVHDSLKSAIDKATLKQL